MNGEFISSRNMIAQGLTEQKVVFHNEYRLYCCHSRSLIEEFLEISPVDIAHSGIGCNARIG
jgi:hypothetical protein